MRVDYIRKLIDNVRTDVRKMMQKYHGELLVNHPEAVVPELVASVLLCSAVERDIKTLQHDHIRFVLERLKSNASSKPNYANSVAEFFNVPYASIHRFVREASEGSLVEFISTQLDEECISGG